MELVLLNRRNNKMPATLPEGTAPTTPAVPLNSQKLEPYTYLSQSPEPGLYEELETSVLKVYWKTTVM